MSSAEIIANNQNIVTTTEKNQTVITRNAWLGDSVKATVSFAHGTWNVHVTDRCGTLRFHEFGTFIGAERWALNNIKGLN